MQEEQYMRNAAASCIYVHGSGHSMELYPMCGVFPAETAMYDRLQALGVETVRDSLLGPAGSSGRVVVRRQLRRAQALSFMRGLARSVDLVRGFKIKDRRLGA
jgi:cobyrinic acid a,c-diamide synthase